MKIFFILLLLCLVYYLFAASPSLLNISIFIGVLFSVLIGSGFLSYFFDKRKFYKNLIISLKKTLECDEIFYKNNKLYVGIIELKIYLNDDIENNFMLLYDYIYLNDNKMKYIVSYILNELYIELENKGYLKLNN